MYAHGEALEEGVLLAQLDEMIEIYEAVSTTTSARALLAKHHVVFQTDPGGSHDESTGGIGDVAFLLGRRRLRGLERRESGVEHFLRPL